MCNNGITVNKGFFVSVTACQHKKFRNLTYVAIFVHNLLTESSTVIDKSGTKKSGTTTRAEMGMFQYFTASLHGK